MALAHPTIVVPGITASYLRDDYPLPPEIIWGVIKKDYERAALHPDDLRYEVQEPARVQPGQVYEVAYEELIEELRYNLRSQEDQPVPVYPFGYDWRQPLDIIEAQLAGFVDEVIDRTKLLRHYHAANYESNPRVNLVGHSMGGLVIAGYLQRFGGGEKKVEKVATLATPFQGSFEAVIKVATGTANLGTDPPSSREREAARLTPALYHLLPSFRAGLSFADGLPKSLFDPGAWQPSVVETIAEFIRLKGLKPANRKQDAQKIFKKMLADARAHRKRVDGLKLDSAGLTASDWLCVVGVDSETRVSLNVEKRGRVPSFAFRAIDRQNGWDKASVAAKRQTGDGTVPYEGAVPKFLARENLVCVTPGDFGYWEVADKAAAKLAGFHGILPNMNMLHRLIVRHFTGRSDRHGNTWGRAAPGVTDWQPPIPGLFEKS